MAFTLGPARFKRLADITQALGLAAIIGGAGDAAVYAARLNLDAYSILGGLGLLVISVILSGWELGELTGLRGRE